MKLLGRVLKTLKTRSFYHTVPINMMCVIYIFYYLLVVSLVFMFFFLFFTNYALHLWCTLINRRCCVSEKMCKQQFFFPSPILMILTKVMVGDQKLNKLLFSSSVSPPEFETLGQKKIQIQLSLSKQ